jgi:hypothetical protein
MKLLFTFFAFAILFTFATSTSRAQDGSKPRLFDSYGQRIADDAGGHVDNFAIQLENESDKFGLIVCYGPSGDGSGTANYILKMIHDYLVNARGIDSSRLQTLNAGRFKDPFDVSVEFWLVPIGAELPKTRDYNPELAKLKGKLQEFPGWDGVPDGDGGGPSQGDVTLAGFADVLKAQPDSIAYIVAFNNHNSTIGTWRRVAKREAGELETYGISANRIKTVFGGTLKKDNQDKTPQDAEVQLWLLPKDTPLPLKEAKSEEAPTQSVQIGTFGDYELNDSERERQTFEGFADVLRANEELSVYIITRPRGAPLETLSDDERPPIDPAKLAAKWKDELTDKLNIKSGRVIVISAVANEFNEGTIEVWIVPRGAALPDPYRSTDDPPSVGYGVFPAELAGASNHILAKGGRVIAAE